MISILPWWYREELKKEDLNYCLVFKNIIPNVFRCHFTCLIFHLGIRNNRECQAVGFLLERTLKAEKKRQNLMAWIYWRISSSSPWVGKRRPRIRVTGLICSMCFLINNQFENKEEKKNSAALFLLVSDQEENPNVWSKIKSGLSCLVGAHLFIRRSGDVSCWICYCRSESNISCLVFLGLCHFLLWLIQDNGFLFFWITWWQMIKPFGRKYTWKYVISSCHTQILILL